jgi:hypothetical protein
VWIVREGGSPVAGALAERHPGAVVLELAAAAGVDPADPGAWAREVAARPAPRRVYFLAGEPDPEADELARVRTAQERGVLALLKAVGPYAVGRAGAAAARAAALEAAAGDAEEAGEEARGTAGAAARAREAGSTRRHARTCASMSA